MIDYDGHRVHVWIIGLGSALMVVAAVGLLADLAGVHVSYWLLAQVGLLVFCGIIVGYGAQTWAAWDYRRRLRMWQDRREMSRIQSEFEQAEPEPRTMVRQIARSHAPPLEMIEQRDPHEQAWRDCAADFLLGARTVGSLTGPALIGRVVSCSDDWYIITGWLAQIGIISKINGQPTTLVNGWTYYGAIRELQTGVLIAPPPRSAPPTIMAFTPKAESSESPKA